MNAKDKPCKNQNETEGFGATAGRTVGKVVDSVADIATTVGRAAVGAAVGSIAGGIKGISQALNPNREDQFWRDNYRSRPYVQPGMSYDDYQAAYRFGWESRGRYPGMSFEEAEAELEHDWTQANAQMTWHAAREAARDAWNRVEYACAGS